MSDEGEDPRREELSAIGHRVSVVTRSMLIACQRCGADVLYVKRDPYARHQAITGGAGGKGGRYTHGGLNVRGVPGQKITTHRHAAAYDANPTYAWACRKCKHSDSRKHEKILERWPSPDTENPPRVLRLRLGADL